MRAATVNLQFKWLWKRGQTLSKSRPKRKDKVVLARTIAALESTANVLGTIFCARRNAPVDLVKTHRTTKGLNKTPLRTAAKMSTTSALRVSITTTGTRNPYIQPQVNRESRASRLQFVHHSKKCRNREQRQRLPDCYPPQSNEMFRLPPRPLMFSISTGTLETALQPQVFCRGTESILQAIRQTE